MNPTKGRIVMITDDSGHEFPAVVIEAHSAKCVSVNAFTFGGVRVMTSLVEFEPGISPTRLRTWHWPERPQSLEMSLLTSAATAPAHQNPT